VSAPEPLLPDLRLIRSQLRPGPSVTISCRDTSNEVEAESDAPSLLLLRRLPRFPLPVPSQLGVRMYKGYDFDHRPWFLISVSPEVEASVRRSTTVGVWILFLVMLGLLCVVLTPQSGHAKAAGHQTRAQHKVQLQWDPHWQS
jgi:hypothetical protein